MAEVTSIELRVITDKAKRNVDSLRSSFAKFDAQAKKSTGEVNKFANKSKTSISGLKTAILGAVSALGAFKAAKFLTGTITQFEDLRVVLRSVTGSEAAAVKAFEDIKDVTKQTAFQVAEVTKAFNILKSQGVEPTKQVLTDFADISAAMGKNITQFAEAVLDAQSGEFERLKEFGIKASKQGDQVSLRFKGVTTVVKNSAAEIQKALQKIARTNFAGAALASSKTLSGLISNLKDQFANLADTIGKGGLLQAMKDVVKRFMEFSEVSGITAESIGEKLGQAVRVAGDAFFFLAENVQELTVAFGVLAAAKVVQTVVDLTKATKGLTIAQRALNLVVKANPYVLAATAIAAIVLALGKWSQETLKAKGVNASLFEIISATATVIGDLLQPAIDAAGREWANFTNGLSKAQSVIRSVIVGTVQAFLNIGSTVKIVSLSIVDGFSAAFSKVGSIAKAFGSGIVKLLKSPFSGGAFDELGKELSAGFTSGLGDIAGKIATANAANGTIAEAVVGDVEEVVTKFASSVGATVTDVVGSSVAKIKEGMALVGEQIKQDQAQSRLDAALEADEQEQGAIWRKQSADEQERIRAKTAATAAAAVKLNDTQQKLVTSYTAQQASLQLQLSTIGQTVQVADQLAAKAAASAKGATTESNAIQQKIVQLKEEIRVKQAAVDFKAYIQSLRDETKILAGTRKQRKLDLAVLQQVNAAKAKGVELTKEQIAELRRTIQIRDIAAAKANERDKVEDEVNKNKIKREKDLQKSIFDTGEFYTAIANKAIGANNNILGSFANLINQLLGLNAGSGFGSVIGNALVDIAGGIFGSSSSSSFGNSIGSSIASAAGSLFSGSSSSSGVVIQNLNATGDFPQSSIDSIAAGVAGGIQQANV